MTPDFTHTVLQMKETEDKSLQHPNLEDLLKPCEPREPRCPFAEVKFETFILTNKRKSYQINLRPTFSLKLPFPPIKSTNSFQTTPQLPENQSPTSSCPSPFFASAILRSTILLHIWPVDCAHYRPCRSAFSIPPGVPPSKAASHLLVSFRSPGLSCASCPAQSGP